ncbi:MAG: extracellular solute-binding protein [Thermodesulfobacteriota bacterium]
MKRKKMKVLSAILPVLFMLVMISSAYAQTQFDPKLISAAKKEGKVTLYNSGDREAGEALLKAFKAKFGISGEQYRATSNKVLSKVMEEIEAKNIYADVLCTGSPNVLRLSQKGYIAKHDCQQAKFYPASQQTEHYVNVTGIAMFIMYNKDLVSEKDAPKEWKDLINPKWKGQIVMPDWSASTSPLILFQMFKDIYDTEFLKKAGEQKFIIHKAHGAAANAVASGENAIAFEMLSDRIAVEVKKGAPVGYSVPTPVVFNPRQMGITKGAPHPNAAKLLMEFALSKEGQKIYNLDYWLYSFRSDIQYPPEMYPLDKIKLYDFTPKMWLDFTDNMPKLIEEANQYWLKK